MVEGEPAEESKLVALIDDELDEDAKSQLLRRLGDDEALRDRYEAFREVGASSNRSRRSCSGLRSLAFAPRFPKKLPRAWSSHA